MEPMKHPLVAGVDDLSLDQRKFDPSPLDIERICRFFGLGKLRHFEKEKNIVVSHSNFFAFVRTNQGGYALKFYPPQAARGISVEYALNRLLTGHRFATPLMHAGKDGRAWVCGCGRLAACYSYIDAAPAWQKIGQKKTIRAINASMLLLKRILSAAGESLPVQKQKTFGAQTHDLLRLSRDLRPYDQQETIEACLLAACRAYQRHEGLFVRRRLHNNAGLTNFLVDRKTVYTLDLGHVREDYAISDLAGMVISCVFFDTPPQTIRAIIEDYFAQHQMTQDSSAALAVLVQTGLIKEYLKNIQREKTLGSSLYPPGLLEAYRSLLAERKKSIRTVLKKGLLKGTGRRGRETALI